jgi:hypothetical protein
MGRRTRRTESSLSAKQHRILAYLRANAGEQTYFKSRLIAADLGLSAREVGTNMPAIASTDTGLDVRKWGYSSATTWMVTPASSEAPLDGPATA